MPTVIATARGFYGHLREIGERFEIGDSEEPGAWMRPLEQPAAEPAQVKIAQTSFAPFTPVEPVYKVKHQGGGNFIVIDATGEQVGETFKKDEKDNTKAKIAAQQEADRLNGAAPAAAEAAPEEQPPTDNLPDA
jgi:hypothetical protein